MAGVNPFFGGFEKRASVRSDDPVYPLLPTVDGYGIGYGYPEKEQDIAKDKKRVDQVANPPIDTNTYPMV